jgi:hypothetical protein
MRNLRALVVIAASLAAMSAAGCHHRGNSHIDGGVLGRVVIYRNGVAFYERNAVVEDGKVTVRVPRDRVDDFLKSLTVVDRDSKKPLSVTIPRSQGEDGTYLTMTLETSDTKHAQVLLTYVTEAPAWKPSYRVVVGKEGKVMLEGWAVVDNTTSEDWKGVLVGVGASSALAFRYDLWSVRSIDRDLLQGEEKFAIAPPTGVSPYSEAGAEELVAMSGNEIRGNVSQPGGAAAGSQGDGLGVSFSGSSSLENQYYVDGVNTTGLSYGSNGSPKSGDFSSSSSDKPAVQVPVAGSLQGRVTDAKSGEKLAGVTVVASSPAMPNPQTAITDEGGFYSIVNLPPGSYQVTFYYADVTVERSGVTVAKGKATPVFQKLKQDGRGGEMITISGSAPSIDPTSTTQGITINKNYTKNIPTTGRTFGGTLGAAAGSQRGKTRTGGAMGDDFGGFEHTDPNSDYTRSSETSSSPPPQSSIKRGDDKLKAIVAKVQKDKRDVVVEVHGLPGTEKLMAARGAAVKNKLVDDGVPATKIHIVPRIGQGESDNVRVLAVAPGTPKDKIGAPPSASSKIPGGDTPVGESHFIADRPMTVKAGSSAMVAMVHSETTGGVVYLYDPISDRGDKRFAFKAVRLDNPTADTLEPGPVTVYGDGRFIGEGITEPVPPHAAVVVPFALDKQIVVERTGAEVDQIAKLVTVQRGVITAELQHRRDTKLTVTSRLAIPTTVYLRHRLESGWALVDAPSHFTKVGDSQLFEVSLDPGQTKSVTISEATPVQRTFDLGTAEALGMMKVFINEPKTSPELKVQIEALLETHRVGVDLVDKIETLRDQLAEYRSRSGELHAQLVTLKAVRTGGDLMSALRTKLADMSERMQKTTIALVETQEKLMLARVKFQNQLAELKLTDVTKKEVSTR